MRTSYPARFASTHLDYFSCCSSQSIFTVHFVIRRVLHDLCNVYHVDFFQAMF